MSRLSPRWRKAKHRGTIASVVLLAVFVVSLWRGMWWWPGPNATKRVAYQFSGMTLYVHRYSQDYSFQEKWEPVGLSIIHVRPYASYWFWHWGISPTLHVRVFPLWIPALLIFVPTGWLWWKDRPAKPGRCGHCRYDLTGLATAICPECGVPNAERVQNGSHAPPIPLF